MDACPTLKIEVELTSLWTLKPSFMVSWVSEDLIRSDQQAIFLDTENGRSGHRRRTGGKKTWMCGLFTELLRTGHLCDSRTRSRLEGNDNGTGGSPGSERNQHLWRCSVLTAFARQQKTKVALNI